MASLNSSLEVAEVAGETSPETNAFQPADRLFTAGFVGLLVTQFLTAVNDNAFRWLIIGIGKQYVPDESRIAFVLMAGTACFVLPYILLAAPAGYLADRFSKRSVIVGCKIAEIIIMSLGAAAILFGSPDRPQSLPLLFVVVALMGAQSALFAPAKLGCIPEMLREEKISSANGALGLVTVVAVVVGTAIGNLLSDATVPFGHHHWWLNAATLIGIGIVGWIVSLPIRTPPAANPSRRFPWDAARQTVRDMRALVATRAMLRVALGIAFFWSLGTLANLNIDQFAMEGGATLQRQVIPLLISLVVGVGLGSVCAGIWSGGRVELGILPLGAAVISVAAALLFTVQGTFVDPVSTFTFRYGWACLLLFTLGFGAGLFDIPLAAYMQHRSPAASRGAILAASNFLTFCGTLIVSVLFYGLRAGLGMSSGQIFLLCGVITIPVFVYIVWLIPQATIRFLVWLASRTIYRIRVYGREHLPEHGGALLTPNHVSWLDGVLLLLTSSRPIRMLVWAGNFQNPWLKRLGALFGAILIGDRPKEIAAALKTAREALRNGELVCIFPEGAITRTGQLQAFKPGMMKVLQGTDAPVIPVYLDELWGSIFSFKGGKFFWKWPRRLPYPISIFFGPPVANPQDVHQVRQAVLQLGATAVQQRSRRLTPLPCSFIRRCKQRLRAAKVADSMGTVMTGGQLLIRTLVLRRLLRRHVLSDAEKFVGVLLPPSAGGVVCNMALAIDRRVAVNLNYTVSSGVMNACIQQAGIRHVLTSRKFMDKLNLELDAEVVYLEDFKDRPTLADKLLSAAAAYTVPASRLEKSLGLNKLTSDDIATVIFTSGSTGQPKGVMLSYGNVASNVQAIDEVVHLRSDDVVLGVLPFFHSFGYTVTLWTVMSIDVEGAYHFNPLDGRQVADLCEKRKGTLLLATPTFLRTYLRRATPEQFQTLEVVVAGAEKLPRELSDAFEEKFGVRPVEGYGATELSPLVSVNVPPSRSAKTSDIDLKEGTVGRPVPGVSAKVTDLDTGETLGADQPGMLWITGPNVMKGYLGREDLTTEVVKDGWYMTGDIAKIDTDGFITITGRESRFSKIGGEMIPHIKIEETLTKLIAASEEEGLKAVVTAVPDAKKGERLVVIHTSLDQSPQQLCEGLSREGLPNLFIPSADSFHQVDELPLLGSGKLDLKHLKQIALERFGGGST
ncbi:MAG: MFS transporter [Planctomycetales bacterium]|nr:MFS transporter [Planctomycetales bacterium]